MYYSAVLRHAEERSLPHIGLLSTTNAAATDNRHHGSSAGATLHFTRPPRDAEALEREDQLV